MEIVQIHQKIYEIRTSTIAQLKRAKVLLDRDLSKLYQVERKYLNLVVKRNLDRFPFDFMFQLITKEWESLRLQIETSKTKVGTRYLPYVFSEQGIAMLSDLLNSQVAIQVNIMIMRTFVHIRQLNKELV